eukprot:CAMPEP_0113526950 /NCGR_PEP_ID=MMETSP0015_2-20120614/1026_1 /TAXON_ID=2838 /ORGANISM="Odontella" /LENGTH=113 /DNA_ID=CAMNT_0000425333 /DNA_START=351 /DNA_END=689 /DNA_ORIENTATION=+ /assembly_acc=CAM_ASM_000160
MPFLRSTAQRRLSLSSSPKASTFGGVTPQNLKFDLIWLSAFIPRGRPLLLSRPQFGRSYHEWSERGAGWSTALVGFGWSVSSPRRGNRPNGDVTAVVFSGWCWMLDGATGPYS